MIERLCSDLDRKEPRYKSPTLLYFTLDARISEIPRIQVELWPILSQTSLPWQRGSVVVQFTITGYVFHPENYFSGFLDPQNLDKNTKFSTPRQIQVELCRA